MGKGKAIGDDWRRNWGMIGREDEKKVGGREKRKGSNGRVRGSCVQAR